MKPAAGRAARVNEKRSAMPMIDVTIPEGALEPDSEARLIKELTDIPIAHEGFDPANKVAQSGSVVFVHRPAAVYVAGERSPSPRYTDAVVRAAGGTYEEVAPRVWVFPTEVPDGQWGSRGASRPLPDIQAFIAGEHERKAGEERLARRRRAKALELLDGALDAARRVADADVARDAPLPNAAWC
jgi:phenylpyruvate tautomerase PptA (4-oxalocrotonate tautomerase family)